MLSFKLSAQLRLESSPSAKSILNINTGRLQANSSSAVNTVIENIWTACVHLMWNKRNRPASQSLSSA